MPWRLLVGVGRPDKENTRLLWEDEKKGLETLLAGSPDWMQDTLRCAASCVVLRLRYADRCGPYLGRGGGNLPTLVARSLHPALKLLFARCYVCLTGRSLMSAIPPTPSESVMTIIVPALGRKK